MLREEQARLIALKRCEDVLRKMFLIQPGEDGEERVGAVLLEIRDKRLYSPEWSRFEDYCQSRWNLKLRHVNKLIALVKIETILGPIGPKINESQARELTPVIDKPEVVRAIVREAAKDGPITAKKLRTLREYREDPNSPPAEDVWDEEYEEETRVVRVGKAACALSHKKIAEAKALLQQAFAIGLGPNEEKDVQALYEWLGLEISALD